jgi:hypothetical protein
MAAGAGSVSALLLAATLAWPDWLELAFHLAPDGGTGTAERIIVALSALAAITCFRFARSEWRRACAAAD